VGLALPRLERLALGAGHRSTRNGACLASPRLRSVLGVEDSAGPAGKTHEAADAARSYLVLGTNRRKQRERCHRWCCEQALIRSIAAPIGIHLRKPKNVKKPPIRTFLSFLASFPSFGRAFDSHRRLQMLKHLRSRLIFYIFQNYNFVARLRGRLDF
jgi:hypothetical protein